MELAPGDSLGPYNIVTSLGVGGMGEVYRAHDPRLDRDVAIKILPSSLALDPQFRERFDREARAISQVSHPHICVLFDVAHAQRPRGGGPELSFLVMEYVEGETLASRLAKGALPFAQALGLAAQIADALDHAHRRGIVHRDLKPGNIMLTKGGAKLLDFGLAKLQPLGQRADSEAAGVTLTAPLTATGSILGTLQYMAPEQLEGRAVDARSDIFAFGAILYEMVTGRRAFEGKSQASIIAAILERDPPRISTLQSLTPPSFEHLVSRCLAKDPEQRWQSARDVLLELRSPMAAMPNAAGAPRSTRTRDAAFTAVGIALGVLLTAMAAWIWLRPPSQTVVRPARFVVGSIPTTPPPWIAISPDGGRVAYGTPGKPQLYLRALDQAESTAIPGTDGAQMPFFSSDGKWLAFFARGKLKKVPFDGGAPTTICDAAEARGGTWGPDGNIVFAPGPYTALSRVSSEGGKPEPLTALDDSTGELSHRWPAFLPDGSGVLFDVGYGPRSTFDQGAVGLYSFKTRTRRILMEGASFPRIIRPGYLLFTRANSLWATRFDPVRQTLDGPAAVVENSVTAIPGWGSAQYAVSDDGTLAYVPAAAESDRQLIWVDRTGHEEKLPITPGPIRRPRISPDGRQFLVIVMEPAPTVWRYDTVSGVFSPQAPLKWQSSGGSLWTPTVVWSPDGRMFAYSTDEGTQWKLWRKPIDASASEEMLLAGPMQFAPTSWSPDGRMLALDQINLRTRVDVMLLPLNGGRTPTSLLRTEVTEESARFSPDGRLLAYSAGFPRTEVYVRMFPGPGATVQVSNGDGRMPAWGVDGRELFYWTPAGIMAATISGPTNISAGASRLLIPGEFFEDFDVTPDGRRFLVLKQYGAAPPVQLQVVTGWIDHVRRTLAADSGR